MKIQILTAPSSATSHISFLTAKFEPAFGPILEAAAPEFSVLQEKYRAKNRGGMQSTQGKIEVLLCPLLKEKGLNSSENLRLTAYKALKNQISAKTKGKSIRGAL